jgi:hypothetical protein
MNFSDMGDRCYRAARAGGYGLPDFWRCNRRTVRLPPHFLLGIVGTAQQPAKTLNVNCRWVGPLRTVVAVRLGGVRWPCQLSANVDRRTDFRRAGTIRRVDRGRGHQG